MQRAFVDDYFASLLNQNQFIRDSNNKSFHEF